MFVVNKEMPYTKEYQDKNREIINEKRRSKYNSEERKQHYKQNREQILAALKQDRVNCPLCGLDYGRLYLTKHIATRHNKPRVCIQQAIPENL